MKQFDYVRTSRKGVNKYGHLLLVESVLGKKLPDGNGMNNAHTNLVVCPTHEYHWLLHIRTRAYEATGDANWRKCVFCKQWDSPSNMYISDKYLHKQSFHRACHSEYQRNWKSKQGTK